MYLFIVFYKDLLCCIIHFGSRTFIWMFKFFCFPTLPHLIYTFLPARSGEQSLQVSPFRTAGNINWPARPYVVCRSDIHQISFSIWCADSRIHVSLVSSAKPCDRTCHQDLLSLPLASTQTNCGSLVHLSDSLQFFAACLNDCAILFQSLVTSV